MGFKNISSLVSVMVFALIVLPMISGQTGQNMQCFSGIACTNTDTCNDYCKPRNNNLGGVCLVGLNCCCCYVAVAESQESSISKNNNNVLITN
ncbi:putative defensin-like protein 89 [Arabidopsis lyrata subsp. lyrata]|uniref:putative defensin-like protein 89 n=1 Tax=Arabidopsis lyrata subsp. lyrata TaxID=81972 RepID=UPI000A29D40B|nr:putative defensin-like protein 89 [Arabidopsis lyrata subsp. lyrata]XP_020874636.1 putative defensin-like protein 89 [Arabidopsis lyrata subsp. lyrata]|eukprot:XP_020874635.1 putative defensin-like protein 89 [Arabidopsis lyrata subsp. lyrata]